MNKLGTMMVGDNKRSNHKKVSLAMVTIKQFYLFVLMLAFTSLISVDANTLEQFHQDYYTQICKGAIACSSDIGVAENLQLTKITSLDSCVAYFSNQDNVKEWLDTVNQKNAIFQAGESKACLDSIADSSCKELRRRLAKPAAIKGCENVIVGTLEEGTQCTMSLECKLSDASCYGTCQTPPALQCGEAFCSTDEYCDTQANSCNALKETGAVCSNFSECKNNNCVDGVCTALRPIVKPRGQCGGDFGHICSIGEFCGDSQCTPFRKKGERCSADYKQYAECEAPLECLDSICN